MTSIPQIRIQACNQSSIRGDGDYVLCWMIAARRLHWNFALDRAVEWSKQLRKPLLILEPLRYEFPWQLARTRRFVLEGMLDNLYDLQKTGSFYYPYVEPAAERGKGLLAALAARATVVVTDEFPCFFLPRMVAAAAKQVAVRMEQVDSNALLPLRAADKFYSTAYAFRRFLQSQLPEHLLHFPRPNPLSRVILPPLKTLPKSILTRWPMATPETLLRELRAGEMAATFPARSSDLPRGGSHAAKNKLKDFLNRKLKSYLENRNDVSEDSTSGLSPYLHFGHISAHEILLKLASWENWTPRRLALLANGSREGWWGMSPAAEAFLDQLITWRELGFNCCHFRKDYSEFHSLPSWAQETLRKHARDPRPYPYTLEEFEHAKTHDPLWNAAQRQLVSEGRIHNYLRMLWAKKILEWTHSPQEGLRVMIELNNRYALDGRDPNSYSGIFWCLGRYDHPWGPERPIFGTVRYMSSENTARKLDVKKYLGKYGVNCVPRGADRKQLERIR